MTVTELYAPLIERDLGAIPAAVRTFRQSNTSHDLFLAVARFAILAYAPSQHAKHAVLATLSAYELRDDYGARWDDLLCECARYAAESRQPWSEPPMLEPPPFDRDQPCDLDALRAAVASRDRLAAELWLAARLDDDDLLRDLLIVASDDFEDFGHKLIVTVAAAKLSTILGEKGRYAAMRIAVWEMASYAGEPYVETGADTRDLAVRLADKAVAEKGSLESMHAVFLYYAAKNTSASDRVSDYLASSVAPQKTAPSADLASGDTRLPIYRLARDYGQCLKAFTLRDARLAAAGAYNLEHASSYADWSFA